MRRGTTTARRATGVLMAVGFVVGLGAVAGCSGDPEPTTTPTVSEEASPSPAPTPTATPTPDASVKPERPEAMDVADSAGAEAAAVYFLQLYPYVYAANDLTEWRALSHPECIFCASVIANVEAQIAAQERSTGGLVAVATVASTEVDPGKWWSVDVDLTQDPSRTHDVAGAVVDEAPETVTYHMDIAVIREGDAWLIRELSHEILP